VLGDLSGEYSFYTAALETSQKATDDAIRRNEELNNTYAAVFNRLREGVTQISASLGQDLLGPLAGKIGAISEIFDELVSGFGASSESVGKKVASNFVKGLGEAISGPLGAVAVIAIGLLFKKVAIFAADSLKSLISVSKVTRDRQEIQAQLNALISREPQLLSKVLSGSQSIEETEKRILALVRQRLDLQSRLGATTNILATRAAPDNSFLRVVAGKGCTLDQGSFAKAGIGLTSDGRVPRFADPIR
jgi:predicted nuclease with TOPRIM domain